MKQGRFIAWLYLLNWSEKSERIKDREKKEILKPEVGEVL